MSKRNKPPASQKTDDLACDLFGEADEAAIGSTHARSRQPSGRGADHVDEFEDLFGIPPGNGLPAACDITTGTGSPRSSANWTNLVKDHATTDPYHDDAVWFNANPRRTHRIRRATALNDSDANGYEVVVRQIEPGRMTTLILYPGETIPDDDDVLHVLFDTATEQSEDSHAPVEVDLGEIKLRALQMKMVGGTA